MSRALVILALLCAVAVADAPRTTPIGYDHNVHDRNLIVHGGDALPCNRCHVEKQGKLVGKPGHAACFTGCHLPAPKPPARGSKLAFGDRQRVCTSCHAEATQTARFIGKLTVAYPPYRIDPDFNITYGHKQHAAISCTQCHDMRGAKPKRTAHDRCVGCHDGSKATGKGPAMSLCNSCHPRAVGSPQPPQLAAVQNTVTSTFSHTKHAARGPLGKDCGTCHAAIRGADDSQLPRPTVKSCAVIGCHDSKSAFATTAACSRCHDRAPERFEVARPTARFEHVGVHEAVVKDKPCASCHPLSPRGDVKVGGHAACATCHEDDFGARAPKICGACHNATEPWRPLVADRGPPDRTEFGATLDHAKHVSACANCHALRTVTQQLRTPRGHRACSGDVCHAITTGPAPHFDSCGSCHRIGLANAREQARMKAPWSVRATFNHDMHAKTPDGSALSCTACHANLEGADVVQLATPKKATCTVCHDAGKTAFKLTGTSCVRCHAGAKP